jgi:O-antigen ligase/polysaccharide polymerase Wzy-like membrane protein
MKIGIILFIILALAIRKPIWLLIIWIVTSPVVTNFINRPHENPFFGSYRLVDRYSIPGFDFRELFNYDWMVLIILFVIFQLHGDRQRTKFSKIDFPFFMFIGAIFISTLYSYNFMHRIRVLIDTFGLCYIAYFLGKNVIYEDQQFNKFLNAVLVLGCFLIAISLSEEYVYRNVFLYRITGPFLYWENLALTLAIAFFIALFKLIKTTSEHKLLKFLYKTLLIFLGLCIFLAQTRTIMACIIIGLIFMSVKGSEIISRGSVAKYVSIVILLIIIIAINPMLLKNTNFYKHRLTKRTDKGRVEIYLMSVRTFVDNPVFGIGFRDFIKDKMNYASQKEIRAWGITKGGTLHNSYLAVAAEIGLMGLIPMILIAIFSYKTCLRYYFLADERNEKLWALTMGALTVIYFLSAMTFDPFFEPTIDNKLYYMCLGISVGRYRKLVGENQ